MGKIVYRNNGQDTGNNGRNNKKAAKGAGTGGQQNASASETTEAFAGKGAAAMPGDKPSDLVHGSRLLNHIQGQIERNTGASRKRLERDLAQLEKRNTEHTDPQAEYRASEWAQAGEARPLLVLLEENGNIILDKPNGTKKTTHRPVHESSTIDCVIIYEDGNAVCSSSHCQRRNKQWDAIKYVMDINGVSYTTAHSQLQQRFGNPILPTSTQEAGYAPWSPDRDIFTRGDEERIQPAIDYTGHNIKEITANAWVAFSHYNNPPTVFSFGQSVAQLETTGFDENLTLKVVDAESFTGWLGRAMQFVTVRTNKDGDIVTSSQWVPQPVASAMFAATDKPLPPLQRVVSVPVFSSDGRLELEPGYHAYARTYYQPPRKFKLPTIASRPSRADLDAAIAVIDDLIGDFYFEEESDRAHAFALGLLPYVRSMIDGPTPLHTVEAPKAGTGKGKLANALLWPALGRDVPTMVVPREEDEWRKQITAALFHGTPAMMIGNVGRMLSSTTLAEALTTQVWTDRILGSSRTVSVPMNWIWIANGNNMSYSNEIARRRVPIRLITKDQEPSRRTGFRHDPLERWVHEHRALLVHAWLTIAQAWVAAGRPRGSATLGSYEQWTDVVGGILEVAGIDGFIPSMGNYDDLSESDPETAALGIFVQQWFAKYGANAVHTTDLVDVAMEVEGLLDAKYYAAGLQGAAARSLGKRLSKDAKNNVFEHELPVKVRCRALSRDILGARWQLLPLEGPTASIPNGIQISHQTTPLKYTGTEDTGGLDDPIEVMQQLDNKGAGSPEWAKFYPAADVVANNETDE